MKPQVSPLTCGFCRFGVCATRYLLQGITALNLRRARYGHSSFACGGDLAGFETWATVQGEVQYVPRGAEVLVLFGDTAGLARGQLRRIGSGAIGLLTDTGRTMVDSIADELGATVVES